jgi:hypothetical protein
MAEVKMLYSRVRGMCCFPACQNSCIEEDEAADIRYSSGEIAHIEGVAKHSKRHNPSLTNKQRDAYPNWILMCGKHHPLVDSDSPKADVLFTVEILKKWKREAEARLLLQTQTLMPEVSTVELEFVLKHLLKNGGGKVVSDVADFHLLAVRDKIAKNKLSDYVAAQLESGIGKAPEVSKLVNQMEAMSDGSSEELRKAFVGTYQSLYSQGFREDSLFEALLEFAAQKNADSLKRTAGLAVLSFYFELCEVFEK